MSYEPIRLFLWYADGRPAGEFVLAPDETRPAVITLERPLEHTEFWQDPRNADMYREHAMARETRGRGGMKYWQHEEPIDCPKGHAMVWLGSVYWICPQCHTLYVQVAA